jgi:hypothetical protein
MFCAPGHIFGGTDGVGFRFKFLRSRTHFRRYRGRRLQLSFFTLSNSFSAEPKASGLVFLFSSRGLIFGGIDGVGSRFQVLRSLHISAVTRASCPVFMFCAPGLIFGSTDGVGSHSYVLRSRTSFWRYRRLRVPFSCSALLDSFSAVPRASCPVFMLCTLGPIFGGIDGVNSCFALPDSFSAVPRASGPVFMFCAPELIFGGIEGVWFSFHVLLSQTHFQRNRRRHIPFSCFALPDTFSTVPRASGLVFMFYAPIHIFGGIDDVGSRFQVLRSRTHFLRY